MKFGAFAFDLVFGAEDMRVVLREAAHPHQPVHRAGAFIAVARAEFGQPQRQVAIGFRPLIVDLNMAGAVHRLQRVDPLFLRAFLVHLDDEHVLAIGLPVAGLLPQDTVDDLRRADFPVARATLAAAHVVFQRAVDHPAVWMPEHHARRFFLQVEQVHLAPSRRWSRLAASSSIVQMGLQVVAVAEGDAIDALQLLLLLSPRQ